MISQELVKELFSYDHASGEFLCRKARGNLKVGDVAGTVDYQGYVRISISGRRYRAHRLVWLYVYGIMPDTEIDHINGIKNDNRLSNLRLATRAQNETNKGKQRNNKSGYKGVSWDKENNKWTALITINRKQKYLDRKSTRLNSSH